MTKSKMKLDYPFEISKLPEDDGGGYLITFPDLPGCMSDGPTIEEAIESGQDAIRCWLAVAEERGQKIPKPGGSHSGQYIQRLPKSLHARLAATAKAEGTSMNQLALSYIAEGISRDSATSRSVVRGEQVTRVAAHRRARVSGKNITRDSHTIKGGGQGKSGRGVTVHRAGKQTANKSTKRKAEK